MIVLNVLLIWLQIFSVDMFRHEKDVAEMRWRGKCTKKSLALNDCNWCRCNLRAEYTCDARVCSEVDMFGHFNDAIRETDPGMEGHGVWRSTQTACEPLVPYRRGGLLCVCNEDGNWPNPVCRDTFRILHEVELSGVSEADGQDCSPSKLYVVGCNVCFCSSEGQLDKKLCTQRKCTSNDPVLKHGDKQPPSDENLKPEGEERALEIYADCKPDTLYKIGCNDCICLRNNRLFCKSCTNGPDKRSSALTSKAPSFCSNVKPGETFSRDCNLCYCDKTGVAYCTVKKCVPTDDEEINEKIKHLSAKETDAPFEEENCTPGQVYKKNCNICYCTEVKGVKFFGCTLKGCERSSSPESKLKDCVKGTTYELNCLICTCSDVNGVKTQMCHVNPFCVGKKALEEKRTDDLASLHGYCEPLHQYKMDCNTCTCLSDGQTVKCSSHICPKTTEKPVEVEIVPIHQSGPSCPKGLSYKVDCNYCFCLSNGNALCTTVDCSQIVWK